MEQDFFELNQNLILDSTWHVKSVASKGEVEILVTIERVRFMADGKGAAAIIEQLKFDSNDQKKPGSRQEKGVFGALTAIVGSQIAVTIDERGDVSKFELPEALAAHLKDNATRELAGFFGDIFTEHGVCHRLTNWLVAFPKKLVAKGDTWRQERPSRLGKSIFAVHSYTFAGPALRDGHPLLRIDVKPELKPQADEADKQQVKITEQYGEGVVCFDDRTGRIVELVLRHHAMLESFAKTTLDAKTTVKLRPEPYR